MFVWITSFRGDLPQLCVGRHIALNNIGEERINNAGRARWQLTNDIRSGACVHERERERGRGRETEPAVCGPAWPSNGLISGRREMDDLIKISCFFFAFCFPPLKVSMSVYAPIPFCPPHPLFFFFLPPFPHLNHSFQKSWDGSPPPPPPPPPQKIKKPNGCCSLFILFVFGISLRLPRWSVLWPDSDGEDGWRVNYMLSKVRLTQQTL